MAAVEREADEPSRHTDADGDGEAERLIKDRLRRIEGQIRGIYRMVDERRPCVDIITQVVAARAALDRVSEAIIGSHVEECLATMEPEEARAAIGRAVRLISRVQS